MAVNGGIFFQKLLKSSNANTILMKTLAPILLLVLGLSVDGLAAEKASLDERLEPLRPFLGKTWKGHFKDSTPEKPQVDVARWERALNGKAVRILHSVNDGVYGGVTGSAEGVTEVKATCELSADGTMHSKSEYLKDGKWVPGHEVTYKEDPKAEVVFK